MVFMVALSAIAAAISVYTLLTTRRQEHHNIVAVKRAEWIDDMRRLLFEFIGTYMSTPEKAQKLAITQKHIDLYLDHKNPEHEKLSEMLGELARRPGQSIEALVAEAQTVLMGSWDRMKLEAGVTESQEKRMRKALDGRSDVKEYFVDPGEAS